MTLRGPEGQVVTLRRLESNIVKSDNRYNNY